jgi:hypothetical protein
MRDFQELGSELAFLRERMVRGTEPADSRSHELALLAAMSAQRARFMPVPRAWNDLTDEETPGMPGPAALN